MFYDFNSPLDLDPSLQHVRALCCPSPFAFRCRMQSSRRHHHLMRNLQAFDMVVSHQSPFLCPVSAADAAPQVIDPPFITREVWEKYAATAKFLLCEGGRLICTTIRENADMMHELLQASLVTSLSHLHAVYRACCLHCTMRLGPYATQVKPQKFQPCIPHLVYQ